jgi:diphthamide biosynthesis methyltransferase
VIYVEFYTSPLDGKTIEEMERMYGKRIFVRERSDIEETAEA